MSIQQIIKSVIIGVLGLVLLTLFLGSFYTVNQGFRGIVYRFGSINDVVADGLHLKYPFVDSVVLVDTRTAKAEAPAEAGTKDLQKVHTTVALNYHLTPDLVKDTASRIGLDTIEVRVIDPRIQETVKAVVAKFSAEELLSKREEVKAAIELSLRSQLAAYNITMEALQITNFSFSAAFDGAIEAKQTAEQKALQAKNDLQRIEVEALQKVTMAKAEAETIRIQAEAIKAQGGSEYVQMKAIEKWNGELPQVSGGNTPFINLQPAGK